MALEKGRRSKSVDTRAEDFAADVLLSVESEKWFLTSCSGMSRYGTDLKLLVEECTTNHSIQDEPLFESRKRKCLSLQEARRLALFLFSQKYLTQLFTMHFIGPPV